MSQAKVIGWGVAVVGAIQLVLAILGGGGTIDYVLSVVVILLGLWGAFSK